MSSVAGPQGCPSSDDLSAVVDGLAPEEITVHIESCSRCQRQVAALRRLDLAIRRQMAPPAGLAARIRQGVRDGSVTAPLAMPRWWMSPVLRLAAAVAVTAAAIAVLVNVLGGGGTAPTERMASTAPTATDRATVRPPVTPAPGALLQGPELRLARAGGGALPGAGAGSELPQSLPRMVRHVWTVPDAAGERGHLKSLLPKGSYEVGEEGGNTVFTVVLPDQDMQKLVDGLAARRWQLVSPDMPQPQRQASVVWTGQDVRYSIVMVQQR